MSKQLNDFFLSIVDLKKINNVDRKKNLQILEILNHMFLVRETTQMQISKKLNISRPSTVGIMNQLIDKGIVVKKESAKSSGGRKPNLFALHKQFFFVLSIQIVRFNIKLVLIDNNHTIIKEEIINSTLSSDSEIGNLLIEHSLKLLNSAKIKMGDLIGIGINVPSLVSAHTIDKFSSYSFQLELKIIKNNFEIKFKKPVVILNDAKSACLAEFRFGLAR
ncbi:ROK family protein, partial [Salegentibacter sp. F14]